MNLYKKGSSFLEEWILNKYNLNKVPRNGLYFFFLFFFIRTGAVRTYKKIWYRIDINFKKGGSCYEESHKYRLCIGKYYRR